MGVRQTMMYLPLMSRVVISAGAAMVDRVDVRVEKLRRKVRFLESLGFKYEEMKNVCEVSGDFGYGIENNLLLKFEYLVMSMERSWRFLGILRVMYMNLR